MCKNYLGLLILGAYLIKAVTGDAEWYIAADGHEYLINPKCVGNWKDAQESCASRNLSLVTFSYWGKYIELIDLLEVSGGYNFWIGGVDSGDNDDGCYWIGRDNRYENARRNSDECDDQMKCVHVADYGVLCHSNDCDQMEMGVLCETISDGLKDQQGERLEEMPDVKTSGFKPTKLEIDDLLVRLKSKEIK